MVRAKATDRDAVEGPRVCQLEASDDVSETTRLLGTDALNTHDSSSKATNDGRWEGYDDFEGLPWWQRPSVCSNVPKVYCSQALTPYPGLLATLPFHGLHPGFRRRHCT